MITSGRWYGYPKNHQVSLQCRMASAWQALAAGCKGSGAHVMGKPASRAWHVQCAKCVLTDYGIPGM